MRILVCGSRKWEDEDMIHRVLSCEPSSHISIIHGAAKGADSLAVQIAKELQFPCKAYPADWNLHGKRAGPLRNSQMLREGKPDKVIAFAYDLWHSVGTLDMVNKTIRTKVPVHWYPYGLSLTEQIR